MSFLSRRATRQIVGYFLSLWRNPRIEEYAKDTQESLGTDAAVPAEGSVVRDGPDPASTLPSNVLRILVVPQVQEFGVFSRFSAVHSTN
jgi:hypothetical protein